jgi:hypothetical protein
MPYTNIPTLADGQILTAAHLNLLAGNANFLGGLGGVPAVSFPHYTTSTGGSKSWHIRHRHRYLHVYVDFVANPDYFQVYYNNVQVYNNGDPSGTLTLNLDLNGLTLAVGGWYEVRVNAGFVGGSSMSVKLIWESPT